MSENDEEKGFVIRDRRIFSDERAKERDEQARKEDPGEQASKETPEEEKRGDGPSGEDGGPPPVGEQPGSAQGARELPKIDFSGFIFSLYASAAFQFGDMADPATGKQEKNLPAVKQMIELIAMLKEKTEGNLTEDEKRTIETLLYELRMRYVKES
ncbi:MAG: DUF1844 domain-containing protein [Syntrophales bacterium]|jgi:hypothetical protein|nr:DUF1844 domain-containing protein [Syntrophales bacterium]MCK9527420.1 DUF1844 domain-containing protein [Syntrophales bacterium]MDX9921522.1 DUF1844 domain-containing protein [Syntrophales bacterium]